MSIDVIMPQLGETVTEGKIVNWFKSVGDTIKPGENLFEVETDKVTVEVPVMAGGVVSDIRFVTGDVAKVGQIVAVISAEGVAFTQREPNIAENGSTSLTSNELKPAAPIATSTQPVVSNVVQMDPFREVRTPSRNYGPATLASGAKITPLARRLAHEAGLAADQIKGSGPQGRISARDVEVARTQQPAVALQPSGFSADDVRVLYHGTPYLELPLDGMRATIARRLVQAKQTIPHFYLAMDVEMDRLLLMRDEANASSPKDRGFNRLFHLTLNDFIIKAMATALQRVPAANAAWANDRILRFAQSDVSVAVAVDDGLMTPVVRNVEQKSLTAISSEVKDLATRARERKLRQEEYQGGATTVSNLGMHGVREFSAIINPPQATILAVGAVQRRPIEMPDGSMRFVHQMTATLSCDHRIVDGSLGAELLGTFKALMENPVTMLV